MNQAKSYLPKSRENNTKNLNQYFSQMHLYNNIYKECLSDINKTMLNQTNDANKSRLVRSNKNSTFMMNQHTKVRPVNRGAFPNVPLDVSRHFNKTLLNQTSDPNKSRLQRSILKNTTHMSQHRKVYPINRGAEISHSKMINSSNIQKSLKAHDCSSMRVNGAAHRDENSKIRKPPHNFASVARFANEKVTTFKSETFKKCDHSTEKLKSDESSKNVYVLVPENENILDQNLFKLFKLEEIQSSKLAPDPNRDESQSTKLASSLKKEVSLSKLATKDSSRQNSYQFSRQNTNA